MKINRWLVKKVLENRLTPILCLIFGITLFSFDVYYALSIYKITGIVLLMTSVAGLVLYLGASSTFYRMKVGLE
jgi:hypothetical protein